MPNSYLYVKIGNRYFCLQQNIVALAWLLYIKKDPFFGRESNYRILLNFVINKYRSRSNELLIKLPLYGHVCIPVQRGYKVFNFYRGTVTKIFEQEVDDKIVVNEIERVKTGAQLNFAPALRLWNINEKWYEEEYIKGTLESLNRPSNPEDILKRYNHYVAPCIEEIILLKPQVTINSIEYINKIIDIIEKRDLQRLDKEGVYVIMRFVNATFERLEMEGNCDIRLAFTHGDMATGNLVRTKKVLKILDWESAMYRSMLHDCFNYFFHIVRRGKKDIILSAEINEALASLQSRLIMKLPDIDRKIATIAYIYRWIYYIERICTIVERVLRPEKKMNNLLRHIRVFESYEKLNHNY